MRKLESPNGTARTDNLIGPERLMRARSERKKELAIERLKNSFLANNEKSIETSGLLERLRDKYETSNFSGLEGLIEAKREQAESALERLKSGLHSAKRLRQLEDEIRALAVDRERAAASYREWNAAYLQFNQDRNRLCRSLGDEGFRGYLSALGWDKEYIDSLIEAVEEDRRQFGESDDPDFDR